MGDRAAYSRVRKWDTGAGNGYAKYEYSPCPNPWRAITILDRKRHSSSYSVRRDRHVDAWSICGTWTCPLATIESSTDAQSKAWRFGSRCRFVGTGPRSPQKWRVMSDEPEVFSRHACTVPDGVTWRWSVPRPSNDNLTHSGSRMSTSRSDARAASNSHNEPRPARRVHPWVESSRMLSPGRMLSP